MIYLFTFKLDNGSYDTISMYVVLRRIQTENATSTSLKNLCSKLFIQICISTDIVPWLQWFQRIGKNQENQACVFHVQNRTYDFVKQQYKSEIYLLHSIHIFNGYMPTHFTLTV